MIKKHILLEINYNRQMFKLKTIVFCLLLSLFSFEMAMPKNYPAEPEPNKRIIKLAKRLRKNYLRDIRRKSNDVLNQLRDGKMVRSSELLSPHITIFIDNLKNLKQDALVYNPLEEINLESFVFDDRSIQHRIPKYYGFLLHSNEVNGINFELDERIKDIRETQHQLTDRKAFVRIYIETIKPLLIEGACIASAILCDEFRDNWLDFDFTISPLIGEIRPLLQAHLNSVIKAQTAINSEFTRQKKVILEFLSNDVSWVEDYKKRYDSDLEEIEKERKELENQIAQINRKLNRIRSLKEKKRKIILLIEKLNQRIATYKRKIKKKNSTIALWQSHEYTLQNYNKCPNGAIYANCRNHPPENYYKTLWHNELNDKIEQKKTERSNLYSKISEIKGKIGKQNSQLKTINTEIAKEPVYKRDLTDKKNYLIENRQQFDDIMNSVNYHMTNSDLELLKMLQKYITK